MAIPTAYTEPELAFYMHTTLDAVALSLDYTEPVVSPLPGSVGSYGEQVNEALFNYGVDDISSVSGRENIRRLRVLAVIEAWKKVMATTAGDYDFSADAASYKRSQFYDMAMKALEQAQSDAIAIGAIPGYVVGIDSLEFVDDPYKPTSTNSDYYSV